MTQIFQPVSDPAIEQNFRALERLLPLQSQNLANDSVGADQLSAAAKELFLQLATAANRKVAFGVVTLKWTASAISASKEVEHGLGTTPSVVVISSNSFAIGVLAPIAGTYTSTKFTAQGFSVGGSISGESGFSWLAIG